MKKQGVDSGKSGAEAPAGGGAFAELVPLIKQLKKAQVEAREEARRRAEEEQKAAREAQIFKREVADATPLSSAGRIALERERPAPVPRQKEQDEQAVLDESLSDDIDIERFLDTDDSLSWRREGIGADVVRRLRRGEWTVRGQIDLHGLRVDEARTALAGFLSEASRHEWRCLRIIHGKGLGSPSREPVLKNKVRKWLAHRADVLAFCQARPNDGGSGALIVLLRAPRGQRSHPFYRSAAAEKKLGHLGRCTHHHVVPGRDFEEIPACIVAKPLVYWPHGFIDGRSRRNIGSLQPACATLAQFDEAVIQTSRHGRQALLHPTNLSLVLKPERTRRGRRHD